MSGRKSLERAERERLDDHQLDAFKSLLDRILGGNRFYRRKLASAGVHAGGDISGWDDFRDLPFTTKQELSEDQAANPIYGSNLTYPIEKYVRIHQTSIVDETSGAPPGTVVSVEKDTLIVAAGTGCVAIEVIQAPGKRAMPIADYLRGHGVSHGDVFEEL